MIIEKVCRLCLDTKSASEFHVKADSKDGLQVYCKTCKKVKDKEHYLRHREKYIAKAKVWAENNPDKVKDYKIKYAVVNSEECVRRADEWNKAHPEAAKANNINRRARLTNAGSITGINIANKLSELNYTCYLCSKSLYVEDKLIYHLEHITPLSKGGTNAPDNISCACPSCNLRKGTKTLGEYREWLDKALKYAS